MNDLLQSQIHKSCKLALPEGLKDLMSDISREVLRAQPQNLNQFIANYLESLLEVREALAIACRICNESCQCTCDSDLRRELIDVGLDEEDLDKAVKIIQDYFRNGSVNEPSLFVKMMEKVSIDEYHIPSIQGAIERAFKRQNLQNIKTNYLQSDHYDEAKTAVQHTMQIYKSKTETEESNILTHLKPCLNISSSSSTETYDARPKFETDDFEPKPDQCLRTSLNTSIENESEKTDDDDLNSEINDVRNTEKYISNDNYNEDGDVCDYDYNKDGDVCDYDYNKDGDVCDYDEVSHLSLTMDTCVTEIENIKEQVIDDESGNESIISLINESLTNSDDSIDEEL